MAEESLANIKKAYEVIKKKYKLPKFEELDKEFEIRKAEENGFIIREVRRCILDRLRAVGDFLGPCLELAPERLHSMIEMNAFDKQERKQAMILFKKIGHIIHEGAQIGFACSEKCEADFIKKVWKEWPALKREALKYMDKITKEWAKQEKKAHEDVGYVG